MRYWKSKRLISMDAKRRNWIRNMQQYWMVEEARAFSKEQLLPLRIIRKLQIILKKWSPRFMLSLRMKLKARNVAHPTFSVNQVMAKRIQVSIKTLLNYLSKNLIVNFIIVVSQDCVQSQVVLKMNLHQTKY